jgi:hypothetical protein
VPDYRIDLFEANGQISQTRHVSGVGEEQAIAWCTGVMGNYPEPGTYPVAEVWDGDNLVRRLYLAPGEHAS